MKSLLSSTNPLSPCPSLFILFSTFLFSFDRFCFAQEHCERLGLGKPPWDRNQTLPSSHQRKSTKKFWLTLSIIAEVAFISSSSFILILSLHNLILPLTPSLLLAARLPCPFLSHSPAHLSLTVSHTSDSSYRNAAKNGNKPSGHGEGSPFTLPLLLSTFFYLLLEYSRFLPLHFNHLGSFPPSSPFSIPPFTAFFPISLLFVLVQLTQRSLEKVTYPFAVFHPENDPIIEMEGSQRLLAQSKTPQQNKKLFTYPNTNHYILVDE